MWVIADADNQPAIETYKSAAATKAEKTITLSWEFGEDSGYLD
jgi:hypothetical protein